MDWIYGIRSKMTAALLFSVVLGLVLFNNFSERKNSAKINEAISSIYEDRLVVESYIFQYSHHFQKINDIIENSELSNDQKSSYINATLSKITALNSLYWKTKLTDEEKKSFTRFDDLSKSMAYSLSTGNFEMIKKLSNDSVAILHDLSFIQVNEAKSQMDNVNSMYSFSSISSQFEIALLIVITFIILILVFASKTLNPIKKQQHFHLN